MGPFTSLVPLDPPRHREAIGVAIIPPDTAVVGGDPVLVELDGSIAPVLPAVPHLTDEIQPIFDGSCALANCHVGDGAAGLSLETARAYDELVGVMSSEVNGPLVAAGDLGDSFLYEKLASDRPRVGDRMPLATALDPLDIEAVRQWIVGGAPK